MIDNREGVGVEKEFPHYTRMEENNSSINNCNGVCRCNCHDHDKVVSFPPGYKFNPTDEELVVDYLKKKLMNKPLPFNEFMRNKIVTVDIYKQITNPEMLAEGYKLGSGEKDRYFFTPRDRRYLNGNRPSRAAGVGYWKATGKDKAVMSNGNIVGHKKSLVFHIGQSPKGVKTNWMMHEYRHNGPARKRISSDDMKLDDFVLCRIYKKTTKSTDDSKSKEEEETGVVTDQGQSPAESALLDENQINQGGSNDEGDKELIKTDENVDDMFMNYNVKQQQQQLHFDPYLFGTNPPFDQCGSIARNIPEINNLHFAQCNDDQQYIPTNEMNSGFEQPPPPPQMVQSFGFNHLSMYQPTKPEPIFWDNGFQQPPPTPPMVQSFDVNHPVPYPPMESDLNFRDDYYDQAQFFMDSKLMGLEPQQPQNQWEHQQHPLQNDEQLYSLAEYDESVFTW